MLFDYQARGIEWLRSRPRALLGDDPGMGKTRQLLEAAEGATLVVAPAYAEDVWREEHRRWSPDLDMTFVSYSRLCERAPNARGEKRLVLNKIDPAYRREWGTVIFDEAHYLKGRKTKWTEAARKLQGERIYLATGTAIVNWAHELWVLLRILKPGDAFLNSYWRWTRHWFETWQPMWGGEQILNLKGCGDRCERKDLCRHWKKFFAENLGAELFLARSADEHAKERTPVTQQTIRVPLSGEQRRAYNELRKSYRTFVAEAETEVIAWSDGGLATKLRKVCTGLETVVPSARPSGKLRLTREILRDRKPPFVLFCWFRDTAEALYRICREEGYRVGVRSGAVSRMQQDLAVRNLQRGNIDILIATLATSSEAISLTRASTAIFVEHSWRPSTNRQAIKRLDRIGQRNPVSILHLVVPGSVDWAMLKTVMKKRDHQVKLMRAAEFAELL